MLRAVRLAGALFLATVAAPAHAGDMEVIYSTGMFVLRDGITYPWQGG